MVGRAFELTNVPFAATACRLFRPPRKGFLDCVTAACAAGAIGTLFGAGTLGADVPASRACT